jgi:hypothetical protein
MIRRRRAVREINFSFDSFLDVVANVVGIIIRLILVVWVGARSYQEVQHLPVPTPSPKSEHLPEPDDPLRAEVAARRREVEEVRERLLRQLRQLELARDARRRTEAEAAGLAGRRVELDGQLADLDRDAAERERQAGGAVASLEEIQQRSRQLLDEIRALDDQPPPKKVLRYHTPVSRPVQAEEMMFECRHGRVTFIDIAALVAEAARTLPDKERLLRSQYEIGDVTGPVGGFRLRYTVERERGLLEGVGGPDGQANFRYGLSEWRVEPVIAKRGEADDRALADGSEFRHVVDAIVSKQTVVTMWVYPDSFPLYRRLRDFLHERDVVVAGRPLPDGVPIASSKGGSRSRGQ